jgi:hypothetical protein
LITADGDFLASYGLKHAALLEHRSPSSCDRPGWTELSIFLPHSQDDSVLLMVELRKDDDFDGVVRSRNPPSDIVAELAQCLQISGFNDERWPAIRPSTLWYWATGEVAFAALATITRRMTF